ncbi:MAG: hypothetical protein KF819_00530 [Labilithrix sp.]|nr:hypothetical protein [Labilithrix sp.]
MIGIEIEARTGDELVRVVRALGRHRYVASRLHLVHAFAVEAACASGDDPALEEAKAWAAAVLSDPAIDRGSKDERLHRRATDAELAAIVAAFWESGDRREGAANALADRLTEIGVEPPDAARLPFDESGEEDVFPLLVDAGWELVPIAKLDPERHRGAFEAFEDQLAFEVARFEEENAAPPLVTLHEMPVLGALELIGALDADGVLRAPFVLWTSGNETYVDYVLRGVTRAAKITA